jgi:hypothetical protein
MISVTRWFFVSLWWKAIQTVLTTETQSSQSHRESLLFQLQNPLLKINTHPVGFQEIEAD